MLTSSELRSAANSAEVHAAAIQAAKDLILSPTANLSDILSEDLARTVALNGAIILRCYLDSIGRDDLPGEAA